ncbi:MAG: hypothetical protein H0U46_03820, partial [Actinobacteria bacterium]|nr:hypothetical protein [Actinomycetota bacterium]
VTAISTDTLTITRAQEGTSARTVVVGDQIAATITAKTLTDAENSVLIYDSVLGADAANFDVSSISATYKHLQLMLSCRSSRAANNNDSLTMRFNNDSGANYDIQYHQALGATNAQGEAFAQTSFSNAGGAPAVGAMPAATSPTNSRAQVAIDILNYAETTFRKNFTSRCTAKYTEAAQGLRIWSAAGEWRSTAAVDRITLFPVFGNFLTGSRLTIYGMN